MSESVGNAYLNVLPKVDEGAARSAGNSAGESIGESIQTGLSAKAVDTAVDLGRDLASGVYEGYAQNEQLVGGIQKLFGSDYIRVLNDANAAWQTAGMSANDYMQNVTSFSASLVNSLGGDTKAAAELANVAMQDMADNVNTFGTDAESVQNAVMGLAKGNYSMLDNLSLGFAGNQQGMLDLINASGVLGEKLTDTSQLADVGFGTMLEAIHAVQEDMGITGTTANEAMGTLEGSANAAKSAWQNVLMAIGSGDSSYVEDAAANLVDALFGTINTETGQREGGLIENVLGLADRAFYALGAALPGMLDTALDALPPEIGGPLREAFESIGEVVTTVAPVVSAAIGGLVDIIGTIAPVVAPLLPIIAGVMGAVKIAGVITTIVGAVTGFITTAGAAITMIGSLPGLIAVVTTALGGPITIIAAIIGAIVAFIATNEDARNAVIGFVKGVVKTFRELPGKVGAAFNTVKTRVTQAVTAIQTTVIRKVADIVNGFMRGLNGLKGKVQSVFDGVKSAITGPIDKARELVSQGIQRIKDIFGGLHLDLPKPKLPHFKIDGGEIPWGIGGKGRKPTVSIDWYARGGYVEGATLIGAGERGGEFIWPSYAPYIDQYADAIARHMPASGVTVNLDYHGTGDPDDLARAVTRSLQMMRMTGAI